MYPQEASREQPSSNTMRSSHPTLPRSQTMREDPRPSQEYTRLPPSVSAQTAQPPHSILPPGQAGVYGFNMMGDYNSSLVRTHHQSNPPFLYQDLYPVSLQPAQAGQLPHLRSNPEQVGEYDPDFMGGDFPFASTFASGHRIQPSQPYTQESNQSSNLAQFHSQNHPEFPFMNDGHILLPAQTGQSLPLQRAPYEYQPPSWSDYGNPWGNTPTIQYPPPPAQQYQPSNPTAPHSSFDQMMDQYSPFNYNSPQQTLPVSSPGEHRGLENRSRPPSSSRSRKYEQLLAKLRTEPQAGSSANSEPTQSYTSIRPPTIISGKPRCKWHGCTEEFNNKKDMKIHIEGHFKSMGIDDLDSMQCRWGVCNQLFGRNGYSAHAGGHAERAFHLRRRSSGLKKWAVPLPIP